MTNTRRTLRRHQVPQCPRCGESHSYVLEVETVMPATLLFGGPAEPATTSGTKVGLMCPGNRTVYTVELQLPEGVRFLRVADPSAAIAEDQTDETAIAPVALLAGEFRSWQETSRTTATAYCATMLTTASAAVPVYFVVLAYLGRENVERTLLGALSLVPPVLFLLAVVLFSLAQRPRLAAVREADFETFRERRLRRLDRWIAVGNLFFILAMAGSAGVFGWALQLS